MKKNSANFRLFPSVKLLAGLVAMVLVSAVHAQTADSVATKVEIGTMSDLPAKPFRVPPLAEVSGSVYLTNEFKAGVVELGQGRVVNGVPVKFNVFNNAMMVMRNGEELKLEFFEEVAYDDANPDGTAKHVVFKAGFPEIDGHNDNSIYQVVSTGSKAQLLKFLSQKVEDVNTLGDYSRREIVTSEQLYVYVPGGSIKKIKKDKQSLVEALPAHSTKINELAGAKKVKTEADVVAIIEAINKS